MNAPNSIPFVLKSFMEKPLRRSVGTFLFLALSSGVQAQTVFWTTKAKGMYTQTSGEMAVDIGAVEPTNANPAGTAWVSCTNNLVFFEKRASGVSTTDARKSRMLAVAIAALKSNTNLRLGIERDANGVCYTTQIYDQG